MEEYGDPVGVPVLYFHGWPASRLEAGLIDDMPVRLLALDRPGYGRSSPHKGRTLLDWPATWRRWRTGWGCRSPCRGPVRRRALCRRLRLRPAGPGARRRLVCPVPPSHGFHPRAPGVGLLFRLGRHPVLAQRLFGVIRPLLRRRIITPRTLVGGGLPAADRDCLTPHLMAGLARTWREGTGRSMQGALSDAQIYARDWQVPFGDIQVPTTVWHGAEDSLIPLHALAPSEAIPGMMLKLVEGEGHYSLALRHASAILTGLTRPAA